MFFGHIYGKWGANTHYLLHNKLLCDDNYFSFFCRKKNQLSWDSIDCIHSNIIIMNLQSWKIILRTINTRNLFFVFVYTDAPFQQWQL